jgi:two-component system nitrogen regulation sensor histidine kinase GlnL
MTSAAEHRRAVPTDSEAILNALPNPVLLVAPDGRIVDANIAAESFFEISTQFLRRQSLKELVPFGSPLLALIDQVRRAARRSTSTRSISARPIGGDRQSICTSPAHRTAGPIVDAAGAHHADKMDRQLTHRRGALGDRAGRDAGA